MKCRLVSIDDHSFVAETIPTEKTKCGHAKQAKVWVLTKDVSKITKESIVLAFKRWAKRQGHKIVSILGKGHHHE